MNTAHQRGGFFLIIMLLLSCTGCERQPVDSRNVVWDPPSEWYLFPTWSPAGDWIAYEFYGSDSLSGIWLVRPDGSDAHFETKGILPDFSPDGKKLALVRGAKIFVYDLQTKESTQLTFEGDNTFPSWSPDGKKIAYNYDFNSLWIMDAEGGNNKEIGMRGNAAWREADWFPNFTILHQRRFREGNSVRTDLFVMDTTGAAEIRLTSSGTENRNGKVSPDGKKIVWERWERGQGIAIWLMNADGSGKFRLADGFEPDWAPDNRHIIFRKQGEYTFGEPYDDDDPKVHGSVWIMDVDMRHQWQFLPHNE